MEKKISKMILNRSLKCGNIFMHVEEAPIEENEIILDMNNKDNNNIPIAKLIINLQLEQKKVQKI